MSLSYDLSKDVLANTFINTLSLGVFARNPFIIYAKDNRNYNDPESSAGLATSPTTFANPNAQGIATTGLYPTVRSFGFNLNATF